jgi:hypothetical protein
MAARRENESLEKRIRAVYDAFDMRNYKVSNCSCHQITVSAVVYNSHFDGAAAAATSLLPECDKADKCRSPEASGLSGTKISKGSCFGTQRQA